MFCLAQDGRSLEPSVFGYIRAITEATSTLREGGSLVFFFFFWGGVRLLLFFLLVRKQQPRTGGPLEG